MLVDSLDLILCMLCAYEGGRANVVVWLDNMPMEQHLIIYLDDALYSFDCAQQVYRRSSMKTQSNLP